jgi:hypothetical protein
MNVNLNAATVAALTFGIGLVLVGSEASAVTMERSFVQNATGACQSALPVFDGQIRKRPLAVQNEGTAAAFVNCSFAGTDRAVDGLTFIYVYADNNTASAIDLSCTLVTGWDGIQEYFPKTVSMPANSTLNEFLWDASDHGGANFEYPANVSCNLPVGTGLSVTFVYFDEDVGA